MDNNNFQPAPQMPQEDPNKQKALISLILGIASLALPWFFSWIPVFGLVVSIITLVLGIVGVVMSTKYKKLAAESGIATSKGMATAGLVLSIIGIVSSGIVLICGACVLCAGALAMSDPQVQSALDQLENFNY